MLLRALTLCVSLFLTPIANATVFTDLWWNPVESGWGVNIVQQSSVLFMTFFVYGPDGTAKWYSVTAVPGAVLPSGYSRWDGDLYETTGPYFGQPYSPAIGYRKVGSAAFLPASAYTGTLAYSVDGTGVSKSIQRQTLRHIPLTGNYFGGYSVQVSSCPIIPVGTFGTMGISMTATTNADGLTGDVTTTLTVDSTTTCVVAGTYRQYGSIYSVSNTAACPAGFGQINFQDISSSDDGLDGNMTISGFGNCSVGLAFSAVRR
jgi:hypothetical protein